MGALGAAFALLGYLAAPVLAADIKTINDTNSYVDPSTAAAFVTIPNLCLEPVNSQGTTTGCDELGLHAVLAAQHDTTYGDVYWEPTTTVLSNTQAFVPTNPGATSYGQFTGYSPIFSQHKYDLFGRSGDIMGVYTREELLMLNIAYSAVGYDGTVPQTDPGGGSVGPVAVGYNRIIILAVLEELDGEMTVHDFGAVGLDFDVDNLPTFERVTGIADGGKAETIWDYCKAQYPFPPGVDEILCGTDPSVLPYTAGFIPFSVQADDWVINVLAIGMGNIDLLAQYFPQACGASDGSFTLSNCLLHEAWIDQIVVGYVEAWASLGGDAHFAENFRSQVGYDPAGDLNDLNIGRIVDQRLEQSVELSGAFTTVASDPTNTVGAENTDFEAGRQTFQQAVHNLGGEDHGLGQMMSQDVEGFIQECLNCNQTGGNQHGFQPEYLDLRYQPYQTGWDVVPTIVHGGT